MHAARNVPGAVGRALRFDGYSTYIDAATADILPAGTQKMTASVWLAVETYPVVEIDVNTSEEVAVVSCIDESARTGFGFFIGFDGRYSFRTFVGGWPLELKVATPLEQYEWINLTAVIDCDARTATLYNNGRAVATSKASGGLAIPGSPLRIGRSFKERYSGPFCLTSFNGIIDDITVWDEAVSEAVIAGWKAENEASLIVSPDRYDADPMRPVFHGMPGANWTNETHGMTFSNGRYHLFFQKNANGPYMSRLHWGHLSSENLYDWREEPIALTPGAEYDIKGCWSGCVFTDDIITGGRPSIIYTGVDYARAVIAQAFPADETLIKWTKAAAPVINGRPEGLSDDFRDPYFFRSGDKAYIIVGSGKSGVGTTTLHSYDPSSRSWSNDGKTFFSGQNAFAHGTFWEMPNVTKIGDKWLFTVTPLNTGNGVYTMYWTGDINPDGTFAPGKATAASVELPGFARDGYGMLSPTIFQHDGKTLALGIVPDKLPGEANHQLGYAHAYSLPREWTLDASGSLCQKPYSGLIAMREGKGIVMDNMMQSGKISLDGVNGRAVEVIGEFVAGDAPCGFTLLDDGASAVKVYYDGSSNEMVVDCSGVERLINDAGVFDGIYRSSLPQPIAKGDYIRLQIFLDHSVLDIFINDKWASSVRLFATARSVENTSVFAEGTSKIRSVSGWKLNPANGGSRVEEIASPLQSCRLRVESGAILYENVSAPAIMTLYSPDGSKVTERYIDTPSGIVEADVQGLHIVTLRDRTATHSQKLIL